MAAYLHTFTQHAGTFAQYARNLTTTYVVPLIQKKLL